MIKFQISISKQKDNNQLPNSKKRRFDDFFDY